MFKILDLRQYRKIVLVFTAFVFLHSLMYFDYININPTYYGWVSNGLVLLLGAVCIISVSPRKMPASYWLLGLLAVPMLSFLPCWLENGQSPISSLRTYLACWLPLLYFLLHKSKISERELVLVITVFAVTRTLITIVQQFTYPDYLFTFRPEGLDASGMFKGIERRSGIYRFCIEDTFLSMFLVFYYFWRMTKRFKITDLCLFLVGLLGVYLDQTRQLMLSTVLSLVLVFLFTVRIKHKALIVFLLAAIVGVVALNADTLFGDLLLMTSQDLNHNNIRLFSYSTYLFEFWGGPLSVVFGNGPAAWDSAYGQQVAYMYENLKLFHSDVGIVGAANLYGVITVLFYLAFLVFFVFRNWKKFRIHIKMYFVAQLINLPMICIFTQRVNCMIFLGFMLFLCDKDIRRYDRRIANAES
jgi:hypothetical protein